MEDQSSDESTVMVDVFPAMEEKSFTDLEETSPVPSPIRYRLCITGFAFDGLEGRKTRLSLAMTDIKFAFLISWSIVVDSELTSFSYQDNTHISI